MQKRISMGELDWALFSFIHEDLESMGMDIIMSAWRNKYMWIPLYVFLLGVIGVNYRWSSIWRILIITILLVVAADGISSKVIKPSFDVLRPCNRIQTPVQVDPLVSCGSGYSFTSSHATNHMALAIYLGLVLWPLSRKFLYLLIPWAVIVGIAQIYVGVHFPSDIAGGFILGGLIGYGCFLLYRWVSFRSNSNLRHFKGKP